jgi:8-oxo-dGTP pyrophosphatase MutT (NUDIX family)
MIHKIKGPFPLTLNGIGGKIEDHDTSELNSALREIKEETNIGREEMFKMKELLSISFPDYVNLHVYYAILYPNVKPTQMEKETLHWVKTERLLDVKDKNIAGYGNVAYFINLALQLEGEHGVSKYYTI